jgi:hypothetical protein
MKYLLRQLPRPSGPGIIEYRGGYAKSSQSLHDR